MLWGIDIAHGECSLAFLTKSQLDVIRAKPSAMNCVVQTAIMKLCLGLILRNGNAEQVIHTKADFSSARV